MFYFIFIVICVYVVDVTAVVRVHSRNILNVVKFLRGNFDNIVQAEIDSKNGLLSPKDGGHEHVTATLTEYPYIDIKYDAMTLASFQFGYDPSKNFRYRLYGFREHRDGGKSGVRMTLFRPYSHIEEKLKEIAYNRSVYIPSYPQDFEEMTGCDVIWYPRGIIAKLCVRAQKFLPSFVTKRLIWYQGDLINGLCEICSAKNPNIQLIVKDDLRLREDFLWINGSSSTADGFIYHD